LGAFDTLLDEGRVWFRGAMTPSEVEELDVLAPLDVGRGARLAPTTEVMRAIEPLNALARSLCQNAQPVRLVAFDKSHAANWALPWHQDRVIAVKERRKVNGVRNWTRKDGVWHCEPSEALLRRMFFLRVCIDSDEGLSGGGLMISPGSHRPGVMSASEAKLYAQCHKVEWCVAERGDVLACMMLLLHRSQGMKDQSMRHRRALRVDYALDEPPSPLAFAV
jgi:hypothetical protein